MAHALRLSDLPSWRELQACAAKLQDASISGLFHSDPQRASAFTATAAGLTLDYSKHLLCRDSRAALLRLGQQAQLQARARDLVTGVPLNNTESRPALHTLLRAERAPAGLESQFSAVTKTRERMRHWSEQINNRELKGHSGKVIDTVVNIGIGGSDLGPRLVTGALSAFRGRIATHYVANVDPADLHSTLASLDPGSTLLIICSKSFRTEETLANATAAREWLLADGADMANLENHFLAITTNLDAAAAFGVPADNCLPMWDWVGGRYSVWSAVGLSCAIAVGWDRFNDFLAGAAEMDTHFVDTTSAFNLPMLMSLLEVWNCNFFGAGNHVVLPYDHGLGRLPDFLQQLTMESNGKRVSRDGEELDYDTAPVLWGSAGTTGQHSFHQLLHQGTRLCPADFIIPLTTHTGAAGQHRMLVANGLAQSRALMVGRGIDEARESLLHRGLTATEADSLAPHLAMPGNRPNSVITLTSVTPHSLGALLALYEHRTFCSGQLWAVNPFDQWGVELGKEIGTEVLARLTGDSSDGSMDPATERLLAQWHAAQDA
ncbi:glucose-6-phosphate isomerase [Kineobactrum sediminis]|uniref:Glucose-6-phosphate isomerase n=1 Tax=Kineobactrum sediminis TaxID=1905677 RepID=A0A2N5XYC9_9GAMM|nr:glucose-6-phosphate isomerase [Kineobactrum sediminis]PLW81146.1 glucose-6-phosphate isomerase [Kineobactrum sediminis]